MIMPWLDMDQLWLEMLMNVELAFWLEKVRVRGCFHEVFRESCQGNQGVFYMCQNGVVMAQNLVCVVRICFTRLRALVQQNSKPGQFTTGTLASNLTRLQADQARDQNTKLIALYQTFPTPLEFHESDLQECFICVRMVQPWLRILCVWCEFVSRDCARQSSKTANQDSLQLELWLQI